MENLYVSLLIFAGATIALMGIFLFASEWKRRKERRQFGELRRTFSDGSAEQNQGTTDRNLKLQMEVARLKQQLEVREKTIEQLHNEQQRLLERPQPSESLVNRTTGQYKENVDKYSLLRSELAQTRQQVDQLMTQNTALLGEINSLSTELTVSQRTIEDLQAIKGPLSGTQSNNQELHAATDGLQQEVANIKEQLQTSETRLSEATYEVREIADRNAKLQTELIELEQQLQKSQQTIDELRTERQYLRHVENENQQLQEEISTLQAQLQCREIQVNESTDIRHIADRDARLKTEVAHLKQQLQASEKRLAQMEHICEQLDAENRRLKKELPRSQERLTTNEQKRMQDLTLRQELSEAQTKQPLLKTEFHQDRAGEPRTNSEQSTDAIGPQVDRVQAVIALSKADSPINGLGANGVNHAHLSSGESAVSMQAPNESRPDVWISAKRNWRFGMIAGMGVIAIAGGVALGLLGTSSARLSRSQKRPVASDSVSSPQPTASEAAALTPSTPEPVSPAGLEMAEVVKEKPRPKPPLRLRGTFKIIHPTEVYNGPSEKSALIANIEPGIEIHVVDSRDGWLEIRSKDDRAGFVRQEAAVRITHTRADPVVGKNDTVRNPAPATPSVADSDKRGSSPFQSDLEP